MIGVIERVKNNVLLKCSTLNDKVISSQLVNQIDEAVYHFCESLATIINDYNSDYTEDKLREEVSDIVKVSVIKKVKRKMFIDSLALQITNDSFAEDYYYNKITLDTIKKNYIDELNKNINTNQLNMSENLDLTEIFKKLSNYVDKNVINDLKENVFINEGVKNLIDDSKKELEKSVNNLNNDLQKQYLEILIEELNNDIANNDKTQNEQVEQIKESVDEIKEEGELDMALSKDLFDVKDFEVDTKQEQSEFDKYDDMTLFNKVLLSLNTKEEKLLRKEAKLQERRTEVDKALESINKNIESNIERENKLTQRKVELNEREVELNSKLSEAEVIFLNMKPLINGLNKIKESDERKGE